MYITEDDLGNTAAYDIVDDSAVPLQSSELEELTMLEAEHVETENILGNIIAIDIKDDYSYIGQEEESSEEDVLSSPELIVM